MYKWKIPAISAGIGALISLIAGLAGGNPFGPVLLRMLFSILIAGALGLVFQYVLRRFLPELGGKAEGESAPAVDIVIEDGLPLGEPGLGTQAVDELPPLSARAGSRAAAEPESILEPLAEAADEPAPQERAYALAAAETLEEAASAEEPGPLEMLPSPEEDMFSEDSLESLPDIGGPGPSPPAGRSGRLRSELAEAQVDSLVKGQDPASLAKAVRTFLRKDQEG
jgi:hypothetical protein